jgi:trimethylamine---corrinoid protein Co-methyltransferase
MPKKGHQFKNPVDTLTHDEILRIHYCALDVLENTGVVFDNEEALDYLQAAGCQVDREKKLVKFPATLVEESLAKAPSSFTLRGRNPKYNLRLGGTTYYYSSFPGMGIVDLETQERRQAVLEDVRMMTKLVDAVDNIDFCFPPVFLITDKPQEVSIEWMYAETFRTTEKPIIGGSMFGCAPWLIEMAEATNQELLGGISITPPLTYPADMAFGLVEYAKKGWPILLNLCLAIGSTGPATLAGCLVQETAEAMAGTVLAQLVYPGVGVVWNTYSQIMDMRYANLAPGAIENAMIAAVLCQQCRFYGIPSSSFLPMTGAKAHDEQAGFEKALALLKVVEAGAHFIIHAGGVDDEDAVSPLQYVIDVEMGEMVNRITEGIKVTDETLALDLIHEVGPLPGQYLGKRHTNDWWQKEQYLPKLAERRTRAEWEKDGSKDIVVRAKARVKKLLDEFETTPLPEEQDAEIARILERCEAAKLGS